MLAVGMNDEQVAASLNEQIFAVGKPFDGAGRHAAILPTERLVFGYFDRVGFELGRLKPFFRLLLIGIVSINGFLLAIREALAVRRPIWSERAWVGLLQNIVQSYGFLSGALREKRRNRADEQD